MRNRVVKQLLMVCMATTLSVSVPVVSWGADETKEETDSSKEDEKTADAIEITKDSIGTIIYDENDIKITVRDLTHKENSGNPYFQIEYMVENNSAKDITITMYQSYIDDFSVGTASYGSMINAGKKGISQFSLWESDYKPYGVEDFKVWESKIKIYDTEDTLFEKDMTIQRDAFSGSSDMNTTETQENTSSEESQSDAKYDELLQKIEELEAKNAELEDKLNQTEEEKSQEEAAEPTATPEPTETPVEETPTPEPTEVPETEPAQEEAAAEEAAPEEEPKPVVEYKDATTIRIVQQALNDAGYNCGNPDGVAGGKTTEAVTKYQTDKGLSVNGLVTDELLQALNVVEKVQDAVQKEASKGEYSGDYTYDQLARNPDTYTGNKIKISGKVLQADSSGDICYARVAMNNSYDTVIFVTYDKDLLSYRLLEDDKITVYGTSLGVYSYEAVSGATITIPWLNADMIEM